MTLVRLQGFRSKLSVQEVRRLIAERRGVQRAIEFTIVHEPSGIPVNYSFKEGTDYIYRARGKTMVKPTKKILEGQIWYRDEERILLIGNLCDMSNGMQGISLQKHPQSKWLPEARYRALDARLVEGLEALFPILFDEHEFEPSSRDRGDAGVDEPIETSYLAHRWYGPRRPENCSDFVENRRAKEKKEKGVKVYKICSNCVGSDLDCEAFYKLQKRAIKKTMVNA